MSVLAWILILVLILINALYVAAEFAAVSVRHSQIRQLAQEGNLLARRLLPFVQDAQKLDRYIAACQIGITLSSLILGAFGQATIARDFAGMVQSMTGMGELAATSTAAVSVLILLTTLQVVFGELVPKSLALQFPVAVSLYTYWPMRWSLAVFFGFIAVLNGSGLFLLHLLGMGGQGSHRHIHSPEEIALLIVESRDGGLLEPEEHERLHHALRLSHLTARQLMVPRRLMEMINVETPIEEVLQKSIDSPYTRLPVYRESMDNVIGMLHIKDLASRLSKAQGPWPGEIGRLEDLVRPITSIPSSIAADQLLKILRERRSRMALLVDEFGGVEGLITLEDVLDELMGAVADEFKERQPEAELLSDGRVRIPGLFRLDEAAAWTNVTWPDTEADTIAGLVMLRLGHVPEPGETFEVDSVHFEVERMDGPAIVSLLVTPKPAEMGDPNLPSAGNTQRDIKPNRSGES